ncbi:MAG: hypothetical protein IPM01_18410 [Burkholderiaceae bacterium]|nr:hypothetical protein [Burkholderiaceae bacterium]
MAADADTVQFEGEGQSGNAGADDHQVDVGLHRGSFGGDPGDLARGGKAVRPGVVGAVEMALTADR